MSCVSKLEKGLMLSYTVDEAYDIIIPWEQILCVEGGNSNHEPALRLRVVTAGKTYVMSFPSQEEFDAAFTEAMRHYL